MFYKLAILSLISLAVATPTRRNGGGGAPPASQCNTAPVQCCQDVQSAGSDAASKLLATVGVVVQDLTIPIGITCTPITVVGVGSGATW
jgi:hypothetical protein